MTGDPERLTKLVLHGVSGPMSVRGIDYVGKVPMTPFKFLSDEELAAVLTFTRNRWGNKASPVYPDMVKKIREKTNDRSTFWNPDELLAVSPLKGEPIMSDVEIFSNEKLEAELLRTSPVELANNAMANGNAERGKALFYKSAACFACHDPPKGGVRLGPHLEKLTTTLSAEQLVDSILRPSKLIDESYLQMGSHRLRRQPAHRHQKSSETKDEIVLAKQGQNPITIKKENIDEIEKSKTSSMPENLTRQLKNRQQFDDLMKYILEIRKQ